MAKVLYLFVIWGSLLVFSSNVQAEPLRVSTEEWQKYAQSDGQGAYFDVLNAIFQPHGYDLDVRITPYQRAIIDTIHGKSDLWIAAYAGDHEEAIYPRYHFDVDLVEAVCQRNILKQPIEASQLQDRRLGWIRGYGYESFLPFESDFREFNDRDDAIVALNHGKLDCFLDDRSINEFLLEKYSNASKNFERGAIMFLPLYFAFSPNDKGRALARMFDDSFKTLYESGKLRAIFEKWQVVYYHDQIAPLLVDQKVKASQ